MPLNGAYTLGEVRAARVVIECELCSRHGDFATQRLIEKFGPDMGLPDLKAELVQNCRERIYNPNAPCQAKFSQETRLSWSGR
jgi:hypothetical protein